LKRDGQKAPKLCHNVFVGRWRTPGRFNCPDVYWGCFFQWGGGGKTHRSPKNDVGEGLLGDGKILCVRGGRGKKRAIRKEKSVFVVGYPSPNLRGGKRTEH